MSNEPTGEPFIDLDALLNPDEQSRFRKLCIPTDSTELAELASVVELHLQHVKELADHRTDVETAERMATVFGQLLSHGADYAADERALLRGAIEYFLMTDDADGDLEDVLGFDDDVRVLNSVLGRIDRADLMITFD